MSESLRRGVQTGSTFGVVMVFLVLIGFTTTAPQLIGGIVGTEATVAVGKDIPPAAYTNLLIFFGLLGLWAGASGARPTGQDSWLGALLAGLLAGLIAGLFTALVTAIFGAIDIRGIDMRTYLASMSHEAVQVVTLGRPPLMGALVHVATLGASGAFGGLLARSLGRGAWREAVGGWWIGMRGSFNSVGFVQTMRRSPATRYAIYALVLALILVLPLRLDRYWNYNLGTVGIYVLLGLGLNIVVGMAGLLDLGYVAFFAIGAYTVALLTAPAPHNLGWSFWAALPVGVFLAAIAGVLLGIPVLRMRGDYLAIVTLGFGEIIRILSKSDLLTGFAGGPRGVRDIAVPMLSGRLFTERDFMYLIVVGCLIVIFVTSRLQNSRIGRAWIAMREDETVAQAMGINTLRYKLLAFAIGAAFAGLGGVLFASRNQFTGPEDHNLMVSINVLSLVIVGGMGSIPGVIMGALVLKGLPEILRQLDVYRLLVFGALLVAMMILRPEGLWPSRRRRLEMHVEEALEEEEEEETIPPEQIASPVGGELQ